MLKKTLIVVGLITLGMILGAAILGYAIQRSTQERKNIDMAFKNAVAKIPNLSRTISPALKLHRKYPVALEKCSTDAGLLVDLNSRTSDIKASMTNFEVVGSEYGFDQSYILLAVVTDTTRHQYLIGCLISSDIEHKETRILK